jgi:hypothetical protein
MALPRRDAQDTAASRDGGTGTPTAQALPGSVHASNLLWRGTRAFAATHDGGVSAPTAQVAPLAALASSLPRRPAATTADERTGGRGGR